MTVHRGLRRTSRILSASLLPQQDSCEEMESTMSIKYEPVVVANGGCLFEPLYDMSWTNLGI